MPKLHLEYLEKTKQLPLNDTEKLIASILNNGCAPESYLKNDNREELHIALSPKRHALFEGYSWKPNAKFLQIGADFGGLTGLFCDNALAVVAVEENQEKANALFNRFKDKDNLEIYVGDATKISFEEKFDYIIISDILGNPCYRLQDFELLKKSINCLCKVLAKDGRMIFAFDNTIRFEWFDNEWQMAGFALDKKYELNAVALKRVLMQFCFSSIKVSYPMPSYKFAEEIFSENSFDKKERLEKYYIRFKNGINNYWRDPKSGMIILGPANEDQRKMLERIIASSQLDSFAPSFIVEASFCAINEVAQEYKRVGEPPKNLLTLTCYEDEERIAQVKNVLLDLLKKFAQVCEKHNLKWYLMYGSLLGAVRCGGMISYDDDIDVALPREDYDKLLSIAQTEFTEKYFLQTPANDNAFFGGYCKLRNCNTTALYHQNWWTNCNEGIFIDIFPLDEGYSNEKKEAKKKRKILFYQRLLYAKAYGFFKDFMDMKILKWKAFKYAGIFFFKKNKMVKGLDSALKEGDGKLFGIYTHYMKDGNARIFKKSWFEKTDYLLFENIKAPVPSGCRELLESLYGGGFLASQPFEPFKTRHGFYKLDESYKIVKERFNGLFKPLPAGKKVVLFGDGLLFEAYFKKYRTKYIPSLIVFLGDEFYEKEVCKIPAVKFSEFKTSSFNADEIYAVICAHDIRAAEEILKESGINEYHFFIENRGALLLANPSYERANLIARKLNELK